MKHENYIDYCYTVKIGPASRGEFSVFVLFVNFHVFLVVVLVLYLVVTSINLTTMIKLTVGPSNNFLSHIGTPCVSSHMAYAI